MNELTTESKKISSEDLWALVCSARREFGESIPRMNDFHYRVANELEGEHYESFVVQNPNNTKSKLYWLTGEQCMLVGMRESKSVRRKVIDKIKTLSAPLTPAIPQTYAAALLEAGRLAQIVDEQAEQILIAAPKAEYHDKVLASKNGLLTTEVASEFNMSAIKLNRLLAELKVQRKVGGRWVLTAGMLGQDLTVEDTYINDDGRTCHSMKWSEKGRKLIHELLD